MGVLQRLSKCETRLRLLEKKQSKQDVIIMKLKESGAEKDAMLERMRNALQKKPIAITKKRLAWAKAQAKASLKGRKERVGKWKKGSTWWKEAQDFINKLV